MNRRRRCIFLGLGATLISIVTAELMLQTVGFGDPPLVEMDDSVEYYLTPNRSYRRFGQQIEVNRYGMRSKDADLSRLDRSQIFSVLGDSIVYGPGLDQDDTLVSQLQKRLREDRRRGNAIVNSLAASSWGPENIFHFYNHFGGISGNIAWIVQSSHDMFDVANSADDPVPYSAVAPYCALHDFIISVWRKVSVRISSTRSGIDAADRLKRTEWALGEVLASLNRDYHRVILVFHATRGEAIRGEANGLEHFRRLAGERGVYFLSTLELYRRSYAAGQQPYADEIHLSATGARLLAELMLTTIP